MRASGKPVPVLSKRVDPRTHQGPSEESRPAKPEDGQRRLGAAAAPLGVEEKPPVFTQVIFFALNPVRRISPNGEEGKKCARL